MTVGDAAAHAPRSGVTDSVRVAAAKRRTSRREERASHGKPDVQVGGGQIGDGLLRPFDQADAIASEVFVQACIQIFFRLIESIKIKVIQV